MGLSIDTQEVDPKVENDEPLEAEGMESFISDLTNAIPGIDEAMSFAEMLKWVSVLSTFTCSKYLTF